MRHPAPARRRPERSWSRRAGGIRGATTACTAYSVAYPSACPAGPGPPARATARSGCRAPRERSARPAGGTEERTLVLVDDQLEANRCAEVRPECLLHGGPVGLAVGEEHGIGEGEGRDPALAGDEAPVAKAGSRRPRKAG